MKRVDLTGQRYGRLVITPNRRSVPRYGRQQIHWLCRCDCGTEKWVLGELIRAGKTLSCGCLHDERTKENRDHWRETRPPAKFGLKAGTPEYKKAYNDVYYQEHKEEMNAQARAYHHENAERLLPRMRSAYLQNREARIEAGKDWQRRNPARIKANNIRRLYKLEQRTPVWVDFDVLNEFYRNRPSGMDIDHIVPIEGLTVEGYPIAGLHVPWNLQYLPPEDNNRKRNRMRKRPQDQVFCEDPANACPTNPTI